MLPFRFIVNGCRIINAPLVFISKIENEDLKLKVLTSYFSQSLFDFFQMKLHKKIKLTVFFQIRNQLFFDNLF